jgi:hypothetical protein
VYKDNEGEAKNEVEDGEEEGVCKFTAKLI